MVLLPGGSAQSCCWNGTAHWGSTIFDCSENGSTLELAPGWLVTSYWSDPADTCLVVTLGDAIPRPSISTTVFRRWIWMRTLAARHSVDYAFHAVHVRPGAVSISAAGPPIRYAEELARHREAAFLRGQIERLSILQPKVVVPYSMTMTYVQPDQQPLNGFNRVVARGPVCGGGPKQACCRAVCVQLGGSSRVTVSTSRMALRARRAVTTCWSWGDTLDDYPDGHRPSTRRVRPGRPSNAVWRRLWRIVCTRDWQPFVARGSLTQALSPWYRFLRRGIQMTVVGDDGTVPFHVDLQTRRIERRTATLPILDLHVPVPAYRGRHAGRPYYRSLLVALSASHPLSRAVAFGAA